ncbi:putative deacetoxyvindoline 4-hydroxylase [Medicago truncatula]|uniref:Putative deacetoxyvindoline 4-hydroxylase n=1 Tax=Medicago truncatula TaxID=3880 RepID=A0A396JMY6_MEDTR|nr:putative deacetoxyvindoline 4-hydroxylase [Medicago truncatula]
MLIFNVGPLLNLIFCLLIVLYPTLLLSILLYTIKINPRHVVECRILLLKLNSITQLLFSFYNSKNFHTHKHSLHSFIQLPTMSSSPIATHSPPPTYDRAKDVKEFDETKSDVKGLIDFGIKTIPSFFIHPPETLSDLTPRSDFPQPEIPTIDLSAINIPVSPWLISFVPLQPAEERKKVYRREMRTGVSYMSNVDLFASKAPSWRDTLQFITLRKFFKLLLCSHSIGNSFDNYSTPSPPPSPYNYYTNYSDNYFSGNYFPGYYPGGAYPPPPSPHHFFECIESYAAVGPSGPSAPLEYSFSFDPGPKGGKMGLGAGLAVGVAAGALGRLALEEGVRYEERGLADMMGPVPAKAKEIPEVCTKEVMEWDKEVVRVGDILLGLLSEGLGLGEERLTELGLLRGRVMVGHYYPFCPQPNLTVGLNSHADPGALTLLLQDHIGGLQVRTQHGWINVEPLGGALIISNEEYKSADHRVLANPSNEPQVSIAVFLNPGTREKLFGPLP